VSSGTGAQVFLTHQNSGMKSHSMVKWKSKYSWQDLTHSA